MVITGAIGDKDKEAIAQQGEKLLSLAALTFERERSKDSDARWLDTARKSGTTSDKIAAMTVVLQEDPVANLRSLDALLGV